MNRYPLWKYAILAIALVIGLVFTAPNFFGEAPAVQVSSAKVTVKLDSSFAPRVQQLLEQAGLKPDMLLCRSELPLEEARTTPAAPRGAIRAHGSAWHRCRGSRCPPCRLRAPRPPPPRSDTVNSPTRTAPHNDRSRLGYRVRPSPSLDPPHPR